MRITLPVLIATSLFAGLNLLPPAALSQAIEREAPKVREREDQRARAVETEEERKEIDALERALIPAAEDDKPDAAARQQTFLDFLKDFQKPEFVRLPAGTEKGRATLRNQNLDWVGKLLKESELFAQSGADEPIFTRQPSAQCKRFFDSLGVADRSSSRPLPITDEEKIKILTSRACMITFWPEGVGEHGELVDADKMRSLRDSVESYSEGKLVPNDKMQQHLRAKGARHNIDIQQHLLFADFLLLQKLMEEGRFEEASKEGSRIVQRRHIQARLVPWTKADESTYISPDNLSNLIILSTAQARCKTSIGSASDELRFLVEYLDWRPALAQTFGRIGKPDSAAELVQRVANRAWYSLDEQSWSRDEKLSQLPFVVGANNDGKGFLLLLKGKHIYAVEGEEGEQAALLTGSEAAQAYSRSLSEDLTAHSSAEMRLFAVSQFGGSYELHFGDSTVSTVSLTKQQLANLKAGEALPKEHSLSKLIQASIDRTLVVYTNPLMSRDAKQLKASDDVAFALVKAYPEARILRDPFSERTREQVKKLNALGTSISAKTIAVVAEDSFEVKDYKLVQNLEDDLRARDISVVAVSKDAVQKASIQWTESAGSLVLVITGHIDSKLAAFVRALGDAGVFRDNYVVFNSCRAKLSRQLASEMATRYGANGVYTYDSLISPEALEPVLLGIPGSVKENSDRPFPDTWRENVESHKLNGIWTICDAFIRLFEESV